MLQILNLTIILEEWRQPPLGSFSNLPLFESWNQPISVGVTPLQVEPSLTIFYPEFWNKKISMKLTESKIMQVLAHQIYNQF